MDTLFSPNLSALPPYTDLDWIIYWVSNSLSIIGCIIILFFGYKNRSTINLSLKFVILLCLANFVSSFVNIIITVIKLDNNLCQYFGFTKVFAGWTGLFWTSAISLLAYKIIGDMDTLDLSNIFTQVNIVSIALSLFTAIL